MEQKTGPCSLVLFLSVVSLLNLIAATANTGFISTNCATTLFPDRCFTSLSPFANKIHHNPELLARVAITVSLSRARNLADHLQHVSVRGIAPTTEGHTSISAALEDCISEFSDAVDQIYSSLKQMEGLSLSGERFQFELSNVQTWMSSAITNEDTCIVGFNEVLNGAIKSDVTGRVAEVKEVTSNALSLVNRYVSKVVNT